jgi:hypothetical protein
MSVLLSDVTSNSYQAIADTNGTVITYAGGEYYLDAGGYVLFNTITGMINSNYPIQLIQFAEVCANANDGE